MARNRNHLEFVDSDVTQSVGTENTNNSQMLVDKHSIIFSGVFMGVNAFTNLMLTSLIAGRIWYISHQNSKYLSSNDRVSSSTNRKYSSIIAIILESGLLYPIFLILFIILTFGTFPMKDRLNISHASAIVSDNLALIAAIAPTLIIVRTGLGISIENNRSNTEQISKSGPLFSSSRFSAVSTFRAGAPRVGFGSSVENTTRTFDDNYNYQNRLSSLSSPGQNAFDESKRGHRVSIRSGEDYRRDSSWYQDHVEALDLEMSDFGTPTVPVPIGLARSGSEETNRDVTLNRAYHYRKSSEVLIA
ncbi:hypothetical protein K435DRAFT_876642 [Dendrothele bispora CBS 962.96]|uniref:Uncharacterized protein n=1 Tax=Dendrothele bispora (strain CBS 962.96) TaxID=1314807 RepID=A0A4S8KRM5_DENBC|nr:hypothetical protein K435DRAFT_876642 [Dendrothele bispora CBS 962.96]